VVTGVHASGRAADAGLRRGDVITQVDGKDVDTVDALRSLLQAGNRPALLLVHRDGATLFLTLDRDAR
jgi:S1-C subfamily serine protease